MTYSKLIKLTGYVVASWSTAIMCVYILIPRLKNLNDIVYFSLAMTIGLILLSLFLFVFFVLEFYLQRVLVFFYEKNSQLQKHRSVDTFRCRDLKRQHEDVPTLHFCNHIKNLKIKKDESLKNPRPLNCVPQNISTTVKDIQNQIYHLGIFSKN